MLNVITTTKTGTRDGHEIIVTTYAVGRYALIRTWFPDLEHAAWKVHSPHNLPSIVDMSDFKAETPDFGVSWVTLGTRGISDARAYGELIVAAADVADIFNRIVAGNYPSQCDVPHALPG